MLFEKTIYSKKLGSICIALLLSVFSYSQPGCPSVNAGPNLILPCGQSCTNLSATAFAAAQTTSYSVGQIAYNPPFSFFTGTSILVAIDDTWGSIINLPFNFCFFGNVYNRIVVGSNGVISFNTGSSGGFNSWTIPGPIPSANPTDMHNCIMGPWEDIDPTNVGDIRYQISGTYPCRMFVVSWEGVSYYGDPNSILTGVCNNAMYATYQTVIYETSNVIEMYIQNKEVCSGWNGGLAIQGIQNSNGTIAYTVPGRNATQWTAQNDAWRFTPSGLPNYSIAWFDGATQIGTGNSISVCPATSRSYTARATYTNCDASTVVVTDDVYVTTSALTHSASITQNISCWGASDGAVSATFASTGSAVLSYRWSPGGALNSTTLNNVPAGTYIFSVTDAANCTFYDTIVLTNPPPLVPVISSPSPICNGGSATLTASGGSTYAWSNLATGPSITVSPSTNTNYIVTATNATGCTATASRTVTVNPNPAVNILPPAVLTCTNTPVTLTASGTPGNVTYAWNTGGTLATTSVTAPGSYSVVVTDPSTGCTASASTTVAQTVTIPNVSIAPPADLTCTVTSVTLTASSTTAGVTYNWGGGIATATNTVSSAGTYSVTVTDPVNGCTASTSVAVAQ
ncbi:MAG: hypothetical protein V4615_07525, partial [Bacteroidota bacterium]